MRSFRLAAVAALAFAAAASPLAAQGAPATTLKVAYINSQVLLQSAPGRAEAEAQFEKEMSAFRTQVQRMGDSLNTLVADFRKAEAGLSPAAKESRMKNISAREEDYQNRARQLEQRAQQRQLELIKPITDQVQSVITQIRAEEGYALIFDVGNQAGVLVAADTTLDITSKVLARLQTMAKAAPSAAKPAAAGPTVGTPAGVSRPKSPPKR